MTTGSLVANPSHRLQLTQAHDPAGVAPVGLTGVTRRLPAAPQTLGAAAVAQKAVVAFRRLPARTQLIAAGGVVVVGFLMFGGVGDDDPGTAPTDGSSVTAPGVPAPGAPVAPAAPGAPAAPANAG